MFTVSRPPPSSGMVPLTSGVTFGTLDKPLTFEARADGAPGPFVIELIVTEDKSKGPVAIEVVPSEGGAKVSFSNPTVGVSSGLGSPLLVVGANGIGLGFMFIVEMLGGLHKWYRLTYEFGEAPVPEEMARGARGSA